MLGSVRLVQVVIMTDRRDFVKALRALARTHGVTQVRDDAAKEKVMQMVKTSVHMRHIPSRSPDLNPVERFWAYLRKKLRSMDLNDLRKKRKPVGRTAFKARVRAVLKTNKTKQVAKNYVNSLWNTCKIVLKKKGQHSGR